MRTILSEASYAEFQSQGFVRTGLMLPEADLDQIRALYRSMPASLSNWSYFDSKAIARPGEPGRKARLKRLLRSWIPGRGHPSTSPKVYEKSIYGSTELIPVVLRALLERGLKEHLRGVSFLAAHDILLEGTKHDHNFGFHDDGFGWDIFFQTGDDVTVFIALQDMNEQTGGRLSVERHPEESILFAERNRSIQAFARYCKDQGAGLKDGRVTREGAETCRRRKRIADEYRRMGEERNLRTRQNYRKVEMSTIDMKQGEVILFNNKLFHDVETWKNSSHRSVYIIRCLPLYEMGLCPPQKFLNDVDCNRYILDGEAGEVRPIDLNTETPTFVACPSS